VPCFRAVRLHAGSRHPVLTIPYLSDFTTTCAPWYVTGMLRSFLTAIGRRIRPREGFLATWWERALAGVAIALLLALVVSVVVDGC
jgi:hypothetical protein